jgi:hypothetical protein
MRIDVNSWYYSPDHGQLCQVIEIQTLWGDTTLPRLADAFTQDLSACGDAQAASCLRLSNPRLSLFLIKSGRCPGRSWTIRLRPQGCAGQAGYAIS